MVVMSSLALSGYQVKSFCLRAPSTIQSDLFVAAVDWRQHKSLTHTHRSSTPYSQQLAFLPIAHHRRRVLSCYMLNKFSFHPQLTLHYYSTSAIALAKWLRKQHTGLSLFRSSVRHFKILNTHIDTAQHRYCIVTIFSDLNYVADSLNVIICISFPINNRCP